MNQIMITPYKPIQDENYSDDKIIWIDNSLFNDESFVIQDYKSTFSFERCAFKTLTLNNTKNINFEDISIVFFDCYIKNFETNIVGTENISIQFINCIVSGEIDSNKVHNVSFDNSIIRNVFKLSNQKRVNISYNEETINPIRWRKLFNLSNIKIKDYPSLIKNQQVYIIENPKILIFKTHLKDKEKIKSASGLYFLKNRKKNNWRYYFNESEKASLNINLDIRYSQEINYSKTKILDSFLNSLSISGYLNGELNVENTKIESWYLRDFSGDKDIKFHSISPLKTNESNSKIEIHKCNLDNTWFDDINFSMYETISFYKTKFGKTTFTSCNFPKDNISFEKFKTLEKVHYPDLKQDNYHRNQYELFLQLKLSLEATGNLQESQKLQAISNDALRKIKDIPFWDKFILCLNRISNNHGLSIKRPFLLFFGFSIFFYILYLWSLDRIFNFNEEIDLNLIGYYCSFIDLTHRNDFLVNSEELYGLPIFWDFLNKIISGFFIYQFVAAFRKYGKK